MKPTITAEIGYFVPFEDERVRGNFSFSVLNMKARMAVIPTTQIGGSNLVTLSEQVFDKLIIAKIFMGADFSVFKKNNFNFFLGSNLIGGFTSLKYSNKNQIIEESYDGGGGLVGIRIKSGVEYRIFYRLFLFVNCDQEMFFMSGPRKFSAGNDYGLGMIYRL